MFIIRKKILLLMLFSLMSGCSLKQDSVSQSQLIYEFEVENILYPEKLTIYSAEQIRFSLESLEAPFLKTPIEMVEQTALGPTYQTIAMEYLNVFDNGEQYGKNTGLDGGFNYSRELFEQRFPYEHLGLTDAPQNKTGDLSFYQNFTFDLKSYERASDLTFKSKAEARSHIQQVFDSLPNHPLALIEKLSYSVSLENMTEQIKSSSIQSEFPRMPQKSDEIYLFLFEQTIEETPLVSQQWEQRVADERYPHLLPEVAVFYNESGITGVSAKNLVTIKEKLDEVKILSPKKILNSFEQQLLLADQVIESCQLKYVIIQGKKELKLIPVWQLTTWQEKKYEQENQPAFVYPEYQTLLYDAGTGERIMEGIEE